MAETGTITSDPLPLDGWHRSHWARMVSFAGYAMPIQYEGIVAEHLWVREAAGMFDVSHMGQLFVTGNGAAAALESLLPADLAALKPGAIRYSLLLADDGGILDDLLVTNWGDGTFGLIVNGATKHDDIAHLRANLPAEITLVHDRDSALLALQGPAAAAALDLLVPGVTAPLGFMQAARAEWEGRAILVSRSGYTGEDGFEISLPTDLAERFASALLADERVKPIGLGARDSLRLEAGLPLYGHDLTTATDPVSADLGFAISKRRRREGGYRGAARIASLLAHGPAARRVGLKLDGRLPAREGAAVLVGEEQVGHVTSGGFSPTLGHPIAMAYVDVAHSICGTVLSIDVRGKRLSAEVVPLPFVPHRYRRPGARK
jgi:aminomethyltransferase